MTSEAIIEKIRKLRALATSSNLHEAAAAARAAEKLLQQHEIDEAQIFSESGDEDEPPIEDSMPLAAWGKSIPTWEALLTSFLAAHYGCKSFRDFNRATGRWEKKIIGRPADIETVRFQWAFFRTEIVRLMATHGAGRDRSWKISFCRGAARAIIEALQETKREIRAKANASALAVVDARVDAAVSLMNERYPNMRTVHMGRTVGNMSAYNEGKRAGSNINQRSQIGARGTRLLKG